MNGKQNITDEHFLQLVLSLQAGAIQQMGKIVSPVTGKVERNLEAARFSIDMLSMLETRTKGNLTEDESKLLSHILYELRMNYVEEIKKGDNKDEKATGADNTEGTELNETSNVEEKETATAEDDNGSGSKEDTGNRAETTDS